MNPTLPFMLAGGLCLTWSALTFAAAYRRLAAGRGTPEAVLAALLPVLLYLTAMAFVLSVTQGHYGDWDAARLGASVAFARGHGVYAGLHEGAVQTTMYPPGWLLAYLPAALGHTPTAVMAIGYVLAPCFALLPFLWLARRVAGGWRLALVATSLFIFAATQVEPLWWSCFFPHADAPALGWGLLATVALHGLPERTGRAARGRILGAACCAACAVWTKQVMLPLLPAMVLWLLLQRAWRHALGLALAMGVAGLVLLLVSVAWFPAEALWLNLVVIPGRCPWEGEFPFNLVKAFLELLNHGLVAGVALSLTATGATVSRVAAPGADPAPARRTWLALLVFGLALIPTSLLGRVKAGGALNSLSPALYFTFAAACMCLLENVLGATARTGGGAREAPHPERRRRVLALASVGGLVAIIWMLQTVQTLRYGFRAISGNACEEAFSYLQANRANGVCFPAYPLAHLLAENRLYHFSHALADRELLGRVPVEREQRDAHWPAAMELVCWTARQFGDEHSRGSPFLPGYTAPVVVPTLPQFRCFSSSEDGANARPTPSP